MASRDQNRWQKHTISTTLQQLNPNKTLKERHKNKNPKAARHAIIRGKKKKGQENTSRIDKFAGKLRTKIEKEKT